MDDLGSCPKDLVVNFKAVGFCNNLGDSWVRVERGEFQKQLHFSISEMVVKGWGTALNPSEGAL